MNRKRVSAFGLIIIGSEILDARVDDCHFVACRRLLAEHRLPLNYVEILRDEPRLITAQLRWALSQNLPFFCCGGIGGTPDDYTRACAAEALGVPITTHPEGRAILEERYVGDPIPEPVLRMVQFPDGARLIPNPVNRIPGFSVGDGHFVPGFPQMAKPMMDWVLQAYYEPGPEQLRRTMILPGAKEAYLTTTLDALTADYPALSISSLPRFTQTGTEVELSVAGDPTAVVEAFSRLRAEIDALGCKIEIVDETRTLPS